MAIVTTTEKKPGHVQKVDVSALTDEEIRQGVIENGWRWGSHGYYIADETARCLNDRSRVHAYLDADNGRLRVYYRRTGA